MPKLSEELAAESLRASLGVASMRRQGFETAGYLAPEANLQAAEAAAAVVRELEAQRPSVGMSQVLTSYRNDGQFRAEVEQRLDAIPKMFRDPQRNGADTLVLRLPLQDAGVSAEKLAYFGGDKVAYHEQRPMTNSAFRPLTPEESIQQYGKITELRKAVMRQDVQQSPAQAQEREAAMMQRTGIDASPVPVIRLHENTRRNSQDVAVFHNFRQIETRSAFVRTPTAAEAREHRSHFQGQINLLRSVHEEQQRTEQRVFTGARQRL